MEHILYKTINRITGEYYIGIHSCKGKECEHYRHRINRCSYLGSGTRFLNNLNTYGRSCFVRHTLSKHNTRKDALNKEFEVVNLKDDLCLNLIEGGSSAYEVTRETLGIPVSYEGKTYPSIRALARAYDVYENTARNWIYKNSKRGDTGAKIVLINGRTYSSISEAANKLNIHHSKVTKLSKGIKPRKVNQVIFKGTNYGTLSEASRTLGISVQSIKYRCESKTRKLKDWSYHM